MSNFSITKPVVEQIEEMKSRLKLFDGDSKAYYEAAYRNVHEAKEKIYALRSEVRDLRTEYLEHTDTTDFILDQAFQKNKDNYAKTANRSTIEVMKEIDYEVSSKLNHLNALRHQTRRKLEKIASIEREINNVLIRMDSSGSCSNLQHNLIQDIRNLENKIDKAAMKSSETVHIGRTYEEIREKLMEEQTTYANTVQALEQEIRCCSDKLVELISVGQDAEKLRDQTKEELKRHEEVIYAQRKRRDLELVNMRRTLELRKEDVISTKTLIIDEELAKSERDGAADNFLDGIDMVTQFKLDNLEKIYQDLKLITGISDMDGMESRFTALFDSTSQLEELHSEGELKLASMMEQKRKLELALSELRIVADTKLNEKRASTKTEKSIKIIREELNVLANELNKYKQLTTHTRMAVENIFLKMNLTKSNVRVSKKNSLHLMKNLAEMNLSDMMERCFEFQEQLATDLEDYVFEEKRLEMLKEIENRILTSSEHRVNIQGKLPTNYMRIFPKFYDQPRNAEHDDQDDPEFRSRTDIKNHAAYLIAVNKRAKKGKR